MKKTTQFKKYYGKLPFSLLAMDRVPGWVRVLLAMEQGPEPCYWTASDIGRMTGLPRDQVKVCRADLVKWGYLQKFTDGGFSRTLPKASADSLAALTEKTPDYFFASEEEATAFTIPKIKFEDWDLVSMQTWAMTVFASFHTWAADRDDRRFKGFWSAVAKKVNNLLVCSKSEVPAYVFTYAAIRYLQIEVLKGRPTLGRDVRNPVAYLCKSLNQGFSMRWLREDQRLEAFCQEHGPLPRQYPSLRLIRERRGTFNLETASRIRQMVLEGHGLAAAAVVPESEPRDPDPAPSEATAIPAAAVKQVAEPAGLSDAPSLLEHEPAPDLAFSASVEVVGCGQLEPGLVRLGGVSFRLGRPPQPCIRLVRRYAADTSAAAVHADATALVRPAPMAMPWSEQRQ